MKRLIIISAFLISLQSCIDEKEPNRQIQEPAGKIVVELGEGYKQKVYFNLNKKTIVKSVNPHNWDIAFQCAPNDYGVILNYANGTPFGYVINNLDFNRVTNSIIQDSARKYDGVDGDIANTIVGEWGKFEIGKKPESYRKTYVIDRGVDGSTGEPLGLIKFQIYSFDDSKNAYFIKYANLDNTNYHEAYVTKDPKYNYVYFSFLVQDIVEHEPEKTTWDIVFTKYSTRVDNLIQYSVVGILNNPDSDLSIAIDSSNISYTNEISSSYFSALNFSKKLDAIGYSWKTYPYSSNPTAGTYKIETNRMYFIKKKNTEFYKLKFFEYYKTIDNKQVSGYPTFLLDQLTF